jgi:protocatechuate 3,4-dioxygenase beta subunit
MKDGQTTRHEAAPREPGSITRRELLGAFSLSSAALSLAGCGGDDPVSADTTSAASGTAVASTNTACAQTPSETIGPYPSLTDLVRSDVRAGRPGTPVSLVITVVNVNAACAAVAGAAVEIWQCDADGHYSQYSQGGYDGRDETFLRGIQVTDASGRVTFTTVFPGWYMGRATHIHVEVTMGGRSVKVTQIAFPAEVTAAVYQTGIYAARGQNPISNTSDGIFRDSLGAELCAISGDPAGGLTATFQVAVAL